MVTGCEVLGEISYDCNISVYSKAPYRTVLPPSNDFFTKKIFKNQGEEKDRTARAIVSFLFPSPDLHILCYPCQRHTRISLAIQTIRFETEWSVGCYSEKDFACACRHREGRWVKVLPVSDSSMVSAARLAGSLTKTASSMLMYWSSNSLAMR